MVVDRLDSAEGEADFISQMFELDAKNYHVWSYRQWLVRRFRLWNDGELEATSKLIEEDVRNNSAWNHRFFLITGNKENPAIKQKDVVDKEIAYVSYLSSIKIVFETDRATASPRMQSAKHRKTRARGTIFVASSPLQTCHHLRCKTLRPSLLRWIAKKKVQFARAMHLICSQRSIRARRSRIRLPELTICWLQDTTPSEQTTGLISRTNWNKVRCLLR